VTAPTLRSLYRALEAGRLMAWAMEHAPDGDVDGAIRCAWHAETDTGWMYGVLRHAAAGDFTRDARFLKAFRACQAVTRDGYGLVPDLAGGGLKVCVPEPIVYADAVRRAVPDPPTLAELLRRPGP
jgi:hypothetical protein